MLRDAYMSRASRWLREDKGGTRMTFRSWRKQRGMVVSTCLIGLAASCLFACAPSKETLLAVFDRELALGDELPRNAADQFVEAIEREPLESRLLLDDGNARYWIVRLPDDEKRSICIVLQSIRAGRAGISCATPERFAERGVGVVLKSIDLAYAGFIRSEMVVLPEDSRFQTTGGLVHLTVSAEHADQLLADYSAMKDAVSR